MHDFFKKAGFSNFQKKRKKKGKVINVQPTDLERVSFFYSDITKIDPLPPS